MRSWRIAVKEAALDKTCKSAADNGGHWNAVGVPCMYTGVTVELCALEKFVHLNGDADQLVLVAIDVPDGPDLGYEAGLDTLPPDWCDMPSSPGAQDFGTRFLKANSHLWLRVPSTIIPESRNLIINPLHPAYGEVRLEIVRPFAFDPRMFRRQ